MANAPKKPNSKKAKGAAPKVVSLVAHKNNLAKHKRAERRKELCRTAKSIGMGLDLAGFLVIGIGEGGNSTVAYSCGPVKPSLFTSFVLERLRDTIASDAQEEVI